MSITPNMSLSVPSVGVTEGPDWAEALNLDLSILDSHDHTSGNGVQIPPAGLDINSDLTFQNNDAIELRTARFHINSSPLGAGSDLGCLYVAGEDLYYNDTNGNQIQITDNGGVAGTPGSIANLVSPASASYVGGSSKFVWQSNTNIAADMDFGDAILRNKSPNSTYGLTLQAPAALSSNYSLVLPALPASQKIMTLDASGNMAAPYSVDNSTIEIATNTIQVKDAGITGAKLNSNVVDNSSLQYTSNQLSVKAGGITAAMLQAGIISGAINFTSFTSNTTWTVPSGVTNVIVVGCGGGGSGANLSGSGVAGTSYGQGGEAAPLSVQGLSVTPGASISVTIGAGGAGVTGTNNGNVGANSAFGSLTFYGGRGGISVYEGVGAGVTALAQAAQAGNTSPGVGQPGPFGSGPTATNNANANSGAGGGGANSGTSGAGGSGKIFVFWLA